MGAHYHNGIKAIYGKPTAEHSGLAPEPDTKEEISTNLMKAVCAMIVVIHDRCDARSV